MVITLALGIAGVVLILASIFDFKTREVPDLLSYGLLVFAIGMRLALAAIYLDWHYVLDGLIGFAVFFVLAILMFYTGQWGGGDAKLIMGLGALLGLPLKMDAYMIGFFFNLLIMGALYGIVYSIVLAVRQWKRFKKDLKKMYVDTKLYRYVTLGILVVCLAGSLLTTLFLVLGFAIALLYFLYIFMKGVEHTAMLKRVVPTKLTEGDWIPEDVIVDKKRICGPKDLGISKEQIKKLVALYRAKKIKTVPLKEGIPFTPAFFLSYVVTLLWGNWVFSFI